MNLRIERDEARERFTRGQGVRYGIEVSKQLRAYKAWVDTRSYSVIVSHDDIGYSGIPEYRWHVSVAGESGVPRWADFVAIVQEVRPGVMFCVPMPPKQHWLNVNPNTLHVWEIRDPTLERQWIDEARSARERFPGSSVPS